MRLLLALLLTGCTATDTTTHRQCHPLVGASSGVICHMSEEDARACPALTR